MSVKVRLASGEEAIVDGNEWVESEPRAYDPDAVYGSKS